MLFDCRAGTCASIEVIGDPPASLPDGSPSPFRGYADASIRRDPASTRLWMAYSWPSIHTEAGATVPGVDIHLARSDDRGASWQFTQVLHASSRSIDPDGSGRTGYTDHEVINLLPFQSGGTTTWIGVRLEYFLPDDGGFGARRSNSFRLRLGAAASPTALSSATEATLGGMVTTASLGAHNLALLSPGTRECMWWNEPALHQVGSTLYLVARCMAFDGTTPDLPASPFVVFATQPSGAPTAWSWRHVGALTTAADAQALGGAGLTQLDLMPDAAGRLLAVLTPDAFDGVAREFVHLNCSIIEVDSLEPPRLARSATGALRLRARITASDQGEFGHGSCTYHPDSILGVVMARRDIGVGLVTSLHRTGVTP